MHSACTEGGDAQVDWEVEPFPAVDVFTVEVECRSVDSGVTIVKDTLVDYAYDSEKGPSLRPRVVELQEEAECTISGWYEDGVFFNRYVIAPVSVTCGTFGEWAFASAGKEHLCIVLKRKLACESKELSLLAHWSILISV